MTAVARPDRIRGAIWGQLVGDAAALGTHWIYDLDELERRYPDGPSGFEAPQPGHYHEGRQPGDQTHYGDGALVLLRSVTDAGRFDPRHFGRLFVDTFDQDRYPGYLDHATLGTLANYESFVADHPVDQFEFQSGADDDQPATQTRLTVLVGRHGREDAPALLGLAETLTRVTQVHPLSLASGAFSTLLLAGLLEGRDIEESIGAGVDAVSLVAPEQSALIAEYVQQAEKAAGGDVVEATLSFGQSCPLAHSLPAALQVLLTYPDSFEQAILSTLRAGGDNAARAAMVGGWLGAHLGVAALPSSWVDRLSAGDEVGDRLERLLAQEEAGQ